MPILKQELQAKRSSGAGYYEGEIYKLIRRSGGAVPLVVIGIVP